MDEAAAGSEVVEVELGEDAEIDRDVDEKAQYGAKTHTVIVQVRVTPRQHKKWKTAATARNKSLSHVIRTAMARALHRDGK